MRRWAFALGGLIVWAAHFFLLYGIASIFPDTQLARVLTLVVTIPAAAADGLLLWAAAARRMKSDRAGDVAAWLVDLGGLAAAISLVAVIWQAMPAIMLPPGL
jgi:hypothetical protein